MSDEKTLPIPVNLDPPLDLCVTLRVPNDNQHLSILRGLLQQPCIWSAWDRDDAHSGKVLADLWNRIFESLEICSCPTVLPVVEEFMPLRTDCNCNVFVDCCDGSQKQLVTTDMIGNSPQPPPQPQPPPGGCSEIDLVLQANNMLLLPFSAGGGDSVTVTNLSGGWYDGGLDFWRCPTGSEYLFGSCSSGTGSTQVGDPIPTIPHMSLIAKDSLGNYYDARSSFTINAGVPNGSQLTFQTNDSDITNNAGSASFHVKICKNTTPATFYYGLCTDFFLEGGHPEDMTWHPLAVGVPTVITTKPPAGSHSDNLESNLFINFAAGFNSGNGAENPASVRFVISALSQSGAILDGPDIWNWSLSDTCGGSLTTVNNSTTAPDLSKKYLYLWIRSYNQFICNITIQPCS